MQIGEGTTQRRHANLSICHVKGLHRLSMHRARRTDFPETAVPTRPRLRNITTRERERGWMNLRRGGNRSQRQTNERWSEGTGEAHHSLFACGFLRHHLPPFPRTERERQWEEGRRETEERWKSERKMRGNGRGRGRRLTNEAGRRGERRRGDSHVLSTEVGRNQAKSHNLGQ